MFRITALEYNLQLVSAEGTVLLICQAVGISIIQYNLLDFSRVNVKTLGYFFSHCCFIL
jgi:hypothetical protein